MMTKTRRDEKNVRRRRKTKRRILISIFTVLIHYLLLTIPLKRKNYRKRKKNLFKFS